ncbi:NACHT, LRR and PYD domains-containing protein 1-like [Sardina pilchardus]|uniref:NACHT, LRR and PYD domains-containing protein 1-like n=1 Tax=Sardina pilchardus TaxID=27697 RepID=UPI002E104A9C
MCAALASAVSLTSWSCDNNLRDARVQYISDLIIDPHCKLDKLVLERCSLTERSCAAIASAASTSPCSLKYLSLSENNISDAGVQHLSDLLNSHHCKLKTLMFWHCFPTEKSCAALISAGRFAPCSLKEPDPSHNELHDAGIQCLLDLLKNHYCKLKRLVLGASPVTDNSCRAFPSVTNSISCSLKELIRRKNDVLDAGVQHLSDFLRNPHCKQDKRVLCRCSLAEKSCVASASAASSTSCSLKKLNPRHNKLHAARVQHLSDLLKNPNCSLKKLLQRWSCRSCAHITDHAHWTLITPSISMENGVCVYNMSSPAGSFECSESGLRWVCASPVVIQYHFSKEELFWAQLQMLRYQPAGPLMDIKLLSGEVEEVHLPHSLCLGGSDQAVVGGAVRFLHSDDSDSGVSLETCELSRFHGKLPGQRFSLWQLAVSLGIPVKTHCEVLIYQSCPRPLVLNAFLVPTPSTARQVVEERMKSRGALSIFKPPPDDSLRINSRFQLCTSCSSVITPSAMTLSYNTSPTFFEVCLENPPRNFNMELRTSEGNQSVWTAVMWQGADYLRTPNHLTEPSDLPPSDTHTGRSRNQNMASTIDLHQFQRDINIATNTQEAAAFVDRHRAELIGRVYNVMPIADALLSKGLVHPQKYSEIRAAATSEAVMREIYECLRSAGAEGKAAFYGVLLQVEPHLLKDLSTPAL